MPSTDPRENPAENPWSLAGQVAVVTGASGGIGRAIAVELAAAKATVIVHGNRQRARAEATAAEIVARGGRAETLLADLADEASLRQFADDAWKLHDGVDLWINNAGADVLTGDAAAWSFEEKLAALWRVDVLATLRLSRVIGERMRERGSGVLLNLGWDQAEHGMAGDAGQMFGTIKGAVMSFTKSLAQTLAPQVRVHCLAPGWIKTSWGETASDAWQRRATGDALVGRWGTPQDVARVARFLASPAADFLTGQVVPVNGGFRFGPRPE